MISGSKVTSIRDEQKWIPENPEIDALFHFQTAFEASFSTLSRRKRCLKMLEKIHPEKSSQKPVKLVNDMNNNTCFRFAFGSLLRKNTAPLFLSLEEKHAKVANTHESKTTSNFSSVQNPLMVFLRKPIQKYTQQWRGLKRTHEGQDIAVSLAQGHILPLEVLLRSEAQSGRYQSPVNCMGTYHPQLVDRIWII